MESIVEVHSIADFATFLARVAAPATAIITVTVTESAYRIDSSGALLDDPDVRHDLAALNSGSGAPITPLAVLAAGLDARRRAGGGPLAIVPCDNVPHNGEFVRDGLRNFASAASTDLWPWIEANVSFVSTSVDRITPRATPLGRDVLEADATRDAVPVVTEPFASWVLSGDFPAGRPSWEDAGATFVEDIAPYEDRKLWLLNGAHTALANLGPARGHATVADATQDPTCRDIVEGWWSEAIRHLPAEVDAASYCRELWKRFENPRILHALAQIAEDSLAKIRVRVVPVAKREIAAGRSAAGAAAIVGAWAQAMLEGRGARDALHDEIEDAIATSDPVAALVALVDASLGAQSGFIGLVRRASTAPAERAHQ